jgi:hypothetical protein
MIHSVLLESNIISQFKFRSSFISVVFTHLNENTRS